MAHPQPAGGAGRGLVQGGLLLEEHLFGLARQGEPGGEAPFTGEVDAEAQLAGLVPVKRSCLRGLLDEHQLLPGAAGAEKEEELPGGGVAAEAEAEMVARFGLQLRIAQGEGAGLVAFRERGLSPAALVPEQGLPAGRR